MVLPRAISPPGGGGRSHIVCVSIEDASEPNRWAAGLARARSFSPEIYIHDSFPLDSNQLGEDPFITYQHMIFGQCTQVGPWPSVSDDKDCEVVSCQWGGKAPSIDGAATLTGILLSCATSWDRRAGSWFTICCFFLPAIHNWGFTIWMTGE